MRKEYLDCIEELYQVLVDEKEQAAEQIERFIRGRNLPLTENIDFDQLVKHLLCSSRKEQSIERRSWHQIDLREVDANSDYFDDLIEIKASLTMALRVHELNNSNLNDYTTTVKSFMSLITNKVVAINALVWIPDSAILFELKNADQNKELGIFSIKKDFTRIGLSGRYKSHYFITMFMLCSLYNNSYFLDKQEINLMCEGIEIIYDQLAIYEVYSDSNNRKSILMNGGKCFKFLFQEKIYELLCMTENCTDDFDLYKLNIAFKKDTSERYERELYTTRELLTYLKCNIISWANGGKSFSSNLFYEGMYTILFESYKKFNDSPNCTR